MTAKGQANNNLGCFDALPRAALCHAPTPLEAMPNLAAHLGSGALWIKRDDCTGLAMGGNKVRQLEFYLGEALAEGADTILITGAVQSNFVRLAAAAARKCGLDCHIQLEARVPKDDPLYRDSGNVLLDRLLGATIHSYPDGEDETGADRRIREIAAELASQGRKPYVIPLAPGHKPLGALGYVAAAQEIVAQMAEMNLAFDEMVVASGSGHTHGGLLFGLRALGCQVPVTGICVRRDAAAQKERIATRCREIAALLGAPPAVEDSDVVLQDAFFRPGYGQLNPALLEATQLAARCEGLILDPVYTAKSMAGFIDSARSRGSDASLLFVHTGGTPAVFAYGDSLVGALESTGA